jgi:hypothetical protein
MSEKAKVTLEVNDEAPPPAHPPAQDEVLLGVPLSQIPSLPWTLESLGFERYVFLAEFGGYCSLQIGYAPDLNPRTFAHGVAYKKIDRLLRFKVENPIQVNKRRQAITEILDGRLDPAPFCLSDEDCVTVNSVVAECAKLKTWMDDFCGASKGTAYNEAAVAANKKIARELMKK